MSGRVRPVENQMTCRWPGGGWKRAARAVPLKTRTGNYAFFKERCMSALILTNHILNGSMQDSELDSDESGNEIDSDEYVSDEYDQSDEHIDLTDDTVTSAAAAPTAFTEQE
jgi:hypothetical protein